MSHPESDSFHEETSSQREIVGEDPWLAEFARAPYDPLISARASGRLTGLAAKRAYRRWWMRLAAFLVGFGMVSAAIGTAYVSFRGLSIGIGPLIIETPFALIGARLIWSAIRRS